MQERAWKLAVVALLTGVLLYGCGGDGDGDGDAPRQTGQLTLSVTDAPVDRAAALYLTLESATLQGVEGSQDQGPFPIPETHRLVNLMEYTGTGSAMLLNDLEIPVGTYKLRLDVDLAFTELAQSSWIAFAASAPPCTDPLPQGAVWSEDQQTCRYPLRIPSGEQSGFKPKGDVTITAGGMSRFTVEFDLRRNVIDPHGTQSIAYVLKPTGLRLVNDTEVGTITGTLDTALFPATCTPTDAKVYVYDRAGATGPFAADDMHLVNEALVTSVPVQALSGPAPVAYGYLVGFIPEGTYAVALTCEADDPEADEDLAFLSEADAVEVGAGLEAVQDLPPTP